VMADIFSSFCLCFFHFIFLFIPFSDSWQHSCPLSHFLFLL
jgi:hypothetical protein